MRIIKTGVALALLLGVAAANAAGLGKLTVNSALGQPLNAEIDIVSSPGEDLESLSARVAPPEAFREARIEYSPLLRQLRFSVEKRQNGQPYLKVTSNAPINDPFLDVLVEVTWPAGRIQREYPILLDPPGYGQSRVAPPTVASVESRAPAPQSAPATPAPEPAPSAPAAPAPSPPATSATSAATGTPSAEAEMAAGRGAASPTPSSATPSSADTYGPVQRGDTLHKIAEEVRPSSVSLEQMLVALYRENQSAFINNNMNRMKTGQILRVPSAEEVQKVTRREATREYRSHVADWRAYREQLASGVAATPAASQASNVASGQVGSAAVAPPAPPVAEPKDVLRLSKSDAAKAGAAGKGGAVSQERLNALQEELTAKGQALDEANSRVAELEKQIRDMQRLLDLKAGAPGKADATVAATTPAKPAEPPKAAEPAKPGVTPAEAPKAGTNLAEAPKPAPATDPAKPADTPPLTASGTDATKVAEAPKADAAKTAPAPKAAAKAPPKRPPPPPRTWTDELLDNPAYLAAGIGIPLVLGLGAFMFIRRRRQNDEGAMSAMPSGYPSDMQAGSTTGRPAAGLVDTGNSSFLTDFDKTGPGTIDTDEVDPVAEAEVYIAYGRDAQAEEILKEAMARDRGRHEIALKLLEIYHARKSATAYETVAKELRNAVGEDHPMWHKAAAMGAQIDPTNPLYAGAAGATGGYAALAQDDDAQAAAKPDLDFDLAGGGAAAEPAPAPDFDLDLDTRKGQEEAPPPASQSHTLDFDLAPSSPEPSAVDMPAESASKEEKPTFDFDLSGLDFPGSKPAGTDLDVSAPAKGGSSPTMDLTDLSLDAPSEAAGGGEAVGTKLELAKAYLEIGDKDGAREILQEVAKEGSSAQKEEAQKLIASM